MKHYNEVELLEHYYLGGEAPEVQQHVAVCTECSARYARLREKLGCSAAQHREWVERKPSWFWNRQRAGVLGRLAGNRAAARRSLLQTVAFAAVLIMIITGVAALVRTDTPDAAGPRLAAAGEERPAISETVAALGTQQMSEDPWTAEELQPYGELLEWETWLTEEGKEGTS